MVEDVCVVDDWRDCHHVEVLVAGHALGVDVVHHALVGGLLGRDSASFGQAELHGQDPCVREPRWV